jgi:hypothetical protein
MAQRGSTRPDGSDNSIFTGLLAANAVPMERALTTLPRATKL